MIHFEKFATRSEATKAESAFKKLSRKNKDAYLEREEENE
ncbi:GIY-YIG nuclease superfamily protein [Listeria seeligeri FSL N1-067]|uniref:GIY-YIG nuclease superfamily protein n=1 Tax=Listeria seeligeri FSL N1-067 TaxID=702453 RepID=E3ZLH3_LISSE|nr:GIY-YIG nuclease superfamily protein [Listeria seeligeri FSL N1-067]